MPFKSEKQKRWMYANKPEMAKKWEKKVKEQKLNENPAVIATAARMAIQNAQGKKVSVDTARKPKYADRDPAAHKKAKSIFQRIKDKFKKKDDKPKKKSAPKKQSKSDADYYARQFGGKVEAVTALKKAMKLKEINTLVEKNVPTDASKWSYYKGQAKKKFDVYPSAYANAWAAKQYKAAGGGWKKESVELEEGLLNEATYVKGKMLVILKNSFNQVHNSLSKNVSLSGSLSDEARYRLGMFQKRMSAAREDYVKAVMRATKPFDKEITGV